MKFGIFLLCSFLFSSYCVYSKPLQSKDDALASTLKEINDIEKFLETLVSKLNETNASEEQKNEIRGVLNFTIEMIELKAIEAIEIVEKLSEIEESIHQASGIQSEDDDLKEALRKMKQVEKVIKKQKSYQKTSALKSAQTVIDIVEPLRNLTNANPDDFTEIVLENEEYLLLQMSERPAFFKYLIKIGYPKIIENLWIAELAVESIRSAYPSETEQLKGIIRDIEAKMFSTRRETKKITMQFEINRKLLKHPEDAEHLIHLRNELMQNNLVDVIYKNEEIFTEDQQEELTDKIIPSVPIVERVNTQFLEDAKYAVALFKYKFPEQGSKLEGFLKRLRVTYAEFVLSVKTIAEKIKLDTVEGERTNPLYIEMFSRITKGKFVDVHMTQYGIYKTIENRLPELPAGDEVKEGLETCVHDYRFNPGPLDEFINQCAGDFADFSPGLFPWEFTHYHGVN